MYQAQQVHIFYRRCWPLKKKIDFKELERLKMISKIDTMSLILLILSKKKNLKNLLEMSSPVGKIKKRFLSISNSKSHFIFNYLLQSSFNENKKNKK